MNTHAQTETGTPHSTLMYREACEGGATVARFLATNGDRLKAIGARLRAAPPASVTTCARGSSDHAATYAKYMIETHLGVPTSTAALSVSSIYSAPIVHGDSLCIAISQSGRSPDLLSAVQAHKDSGAFVVALVNDITSPLAALADEALPLMAGPEISVAATKSYIASLAGIAALVAAWAENDALAGGLAALPAELERAATLDWSAAMPLGETGRSLFVIGRGYGYGIAQEAALKLKETCGLHAEAFSAAEVRHGPMAIVGEGFPILAFATSDEAGEGVRAVSREFHGRGARVALADPDWTPGSDESGADDILPALLNIAELEPILMIQSFYIYANALSLARGFDPDVPPHLNKVTSTR